MPNSLVIEATQGNLHTVIDFIDEELEALDCPMKAQTQIDLCAEEIFINIASYAYPDGNGMAEIAVEPVDSGVAITFIDSGTPYNPLEKADPDITLDAESRAIGGLGIFIVKKVIDKAEYAYEGGKNKLKLTKMFK